MQRFNTYILHIYKYNIEVTCIWHFSECLCCNGSYSSYVRWCKVRLWCPVEKYPWSLGTTTLLSHLLELLEDLVTSSVGTTQPS